MNDDHAAERARDAAMRAERAADQTDARVRDADRWMRWGVALVLGAVLSQVLLTLGLYDRVASMQQQLSSLQERTSSMDERMSAVETEIEGLRTVVENEIEGLRTAVERLVDGSD